VRAARNTPDGYVEAGSLVLDARLKRRLFLLSLPWFVVSLYVAGTDRPAPF